mgnify:CR=1 FL=1
MRMESFDANFITDGVKGTPHIVWVKRSAELGAEYKVIIFVGFTSFFLAFFLPFKHIRQHLYSNIIEGNRAFACFRLGGTKV